MVTFRELLTTMSKYNLTTGFGELAELIMGATQFVGDLIMGASQFVDDRFRNISQKSRRFKII